jgi:hypothetical protein
VPWPEAESIENEIVKALGSESRLPAKDASARPPNREVASPVKATTPTTTLGDLAERLEEALAREVQSASQRGSRLDLDDLGPGRERHGIAAAGEKRTPIHNPAPELRADPEQRLTADRTSKAEAGAIAPIGEAEGRREARAHIERQDEAPVISLNARRREPIDPLEDEMARLLGELTGDTGRR